MAEPSDEPALDIARILATLDRHDVAYVLVGGVAAAAHGATRLTRDLDCLPERSNENLERLAAALQELNARLRVRGLDDAEAARLPVQITADTLAALQISTWRTDAGDLDVLTDLTDRDGERLEYPQLVARSLPVELDGIPVRVAALSDVIASKEQADRPKDREALAELYELEARRQHRGGSG